MNKFFAGLLLCGGLSATSFANEIYKHIPFDHIALTQHDQLIINYDFTQKKNVHCEAKNGKAMMVFYYKGHQKTADLPITLESDHIPLPDNTNEALADVSGQFIISTHPSQNKKEVAIHCQYGS